MDVEVEKSGMGFNQYSRQVAYITNENCKPVSSTARRNELWIFHADERLKWRPFGEVASETSGKAFTAIEAVAMDEDFMSSESAQSRMLEPDLRRGSIARMHVSVCSYDTLILTTLPRYLFTSGSIRSTLCPGRYQIDPLLY